MKHAAALSLVFFLSLPLLQARTWKDAQGRAIEADLVSATDAEVTIAKDGRQFSIALDTLCEEDQQYVKQWLEEQAEGGNDDGGGGDEPKPEPRPGEVTFAGQPLVTGGQVNKYDFAYSEEDLETVKKKHKSDDTGFKIAIAVPHDFNPAGPMKVFIPRTAVNNEAQGRAGNFSVVGFYAKKCVESGWVCFTYDTNLGRKNHNMDQVRAFEKLSQEWPGFKNAEFAVGGFSGGAKACWFDVAFLLKNDCKVIGAMLSGVNEDFSERTRKEFGAPKGPYKDIKVHLTNNANWEGQNELQERMEDSFKRSGIRKIKRTMHNGKHNLDISEIPIGLQWFNQKD